MRLLVRLFCLSIATASFSTPAFADDAKADKSVKISIQADVGASGKALAAAGDAFAGAGKRWAALGAYAHGFVQTRDATFLYAMGHVHKAMGHQDDAKALFHMYLSAPGKATLKYKAEAEAEPGAKAMGKVADVGAGVFTPVKLGLAASVDASAKASAKAADEAYAAAKYRDAVRGYLEAYAKSQQPVLLYGAAQAAARAGVAAQARGHLLGYLAAQPGGAYAKDSKTLLLALGGHNSRATTLHVPAKMSAEVKAAAEEGDKAFAAGRYADAMKAYDKEYAKKPAIELRRKKLVAAFYHRTHNELLAMSKAYKEPAAAVAPALVDDRFNVVDIDVSLLGIDIDLDVSLF